MTSAHWVIGIVLLAVFVFFLVVFKIMRLLFKIVIFLLCFAIVFVLINRLRLQGVPGSPKIEHSQGTH
jgi:hypothetical protein